MSAPRTAAAADDLVRVYRVVEKAELDDLIARGRFFSPPGRSTPTGQPGKWFYASADEALDTARAWRIDQGVKT